MKDLGLDEESMENLARTLRMDRTDPEKKIFGTSNVLQSNSIFVIESVITATLGKTVIASAVGGCAQVAPIFGQVISSVTSYLTVKSSLQSLLNEIKLLALKCVDKLLTFAE
jgi:uncharacterized membrane protein YtjA (UPF0391 family)